MNQKEKTRNLFDLYKNYYKLGIHHFIGNSGHAIFTGLLYKFNELGFPDELKISAKEMFALSGIGDVRTLRNARKILITYLHENTNPDSWIIQYEENKIKEYGTYKINYVYLLELYCNVTVELQNDSNNTGTLQEDYSKKSRLSTKIDADLLPKSAKNAPLSSTIQNKTKQNETSSSSTSNVQSTIQPAEKNPIDSSLKDNSENKTKKYTDPLAQGRDVSGRWHPPSEVAKEGDNGKKPSAKPPDAESNFEFIASQQRDVQLVLLKRLTEEKKAEFYEWVKGNKEVNGG